MQAFVPSPRQLEAFKSADPAHPLVLFYQYSYERPTADDPCGADLARLAAQHAGRLAWAARQEQVLIGAVGAFQQNCRLDFARGDKALEFVESTEHGRVLQGLASLQVAVVNAQPRTVALLSGLLARVLPWVPFDNSVDPGEEPGVGTSGVMPTAAAVAELKGHPDPQAPVVMVNWLKYRDRANYPDGAAERPASGREAYHRYGKVALVTTHSIGAKLIFAGRYRQILVGNNGDPGLGLWDEFVLMQYPGRARFALMTSLKRYRKALHHREAGLTERGQGLAVTRPLPEFEWRR